MSTPHYPLVEVQCHEHKGKTYIYRARLIGQTIKCARCGVDVLAAGDELHDIRKLKGGEP